MVLYCFSEAASWYMYYYLWVTWGDGCNNLTCTCMEGWEPASPVNISCVKKNSGKNSGGTIAGAVIGGIFGGILLVGAGVVIVVLSSRLRAANRRKKSGEVELSTVGYKDLNAEKWALSYLKLTNQADGTTNKLYSASSCYLQ